MSAASTASSVSRVGGVHRDPRRDSNRSTSAKTSGADLERFLREARAAAALNHPHICTIHEIGEHAGQRFIAMELLEGRTLQQQIAAGALDVDALLAFGSEIAECQANSSRRSVDQAMIREVTNKVT